MPRRQAVTRPLLIVLLLVTPLLAAPVKKLQDRIASILSAPDLAHGFWGIEVESLATGKILYSQNADKLFTPASNTKLFTTAAALALIGPDYKFRTTVETAGTLDRYGRLNGDLVLVGRGDPNLSGRELPYNLKTQRNDDAIQALEALADALVQKGVKFVDGDIVGDDSYFAFERYGEGWSQDDLVSSDGAPASALTINDNVIFINVMPPRGPKAVCEPCPPNAPAKKPLSASSRLPITTTSTIASSPHQRERNATSSTIANRVPLF